MFHEHAHIACVCVHVLQGLKENMGYLVGDCLLAASFLSYMGPFLSNYREELLAIWMTQVERSRTFSQVWRSGSAAQSQKCLFLDAFFNVLRCRS